MTWRKAQAIFLAFSSTATFIVCVGCGQMLSPFMTSSPYVNGTWEGRFVSVPVTDYHGRTYDAAALDIETGPRVLRSAGGFRTVIKEGDDLALLCPVGVAIVNPNELGVPAGSRVKVKGRMFMAGAKKFFQTERSGGGIAEPVSLPGRKGGELIIRLHGKPKLLRD